MCGKPCESWYKSIEEQHKRWIPWLCKRKTILGLAINHGVEYFETSFS